MTSTCVTKSRVKLHIGCGPVYLRGWYNVDIVGDHMALVSERPDLVEKLETDESQYYARHADKTIEKLRQGPSNVRGVCDVHGSILALPFPENSVDEILARQVFEHLSCYDARAALIECDRVLKAGGILRLDVPDVEATAAALTSTQDPFYIRHLFGNRNTDHGYHLMGYTREQLKRLVESFGFMLEEEEPNIHFYPAFCLRFRKLPYGRPAWVYVFEHLSELKIEDHWRCVDVGPRNFPWPRANEYIDIDPTWRPAGDKPFHVADIHGPLPFADKSIDFLYCSHVFEHLEDPVSAAAEVSRVAKRGLIVTPHPFKEALTLFDEPDHRWLVTPRFDRIMRKSVLRFAPMPVERVRALAEVDAQKATCRLFRNGPATAGYDALFLRQWFYRIEAHLDTIHYWEDDLLVEVE